MLTMRINVAALVLFIQTLQCLASDDSPFILENQASGFCLLQRSSRCQTVRWTSGNRLFSPVLKKCLGVPGKTVGSEVNLYDCDEKSDLQKWECRNGTLLALKDQKLYIQLQSKETAVLSREVTANSHLTVSSSTSGACSRTQRVLYTIRGNAYGRPCMFPFLYKDKWYADCTDFESSVRQPWCAIETKYENQLWGYCPTTSTDKWNTNPISGAYYQANTHSALSWHQAQASCKQQDSSLLSLTDPNEEAFITALLHRDHQQFWIGLSLDLEHGWKWSDGKPLRFLRWNSGYPLADPSNCALVDSSEQLYWKSSPCSRKLGYICYKEKASLPPIQVEEGFCPSPWIPYNGYCFNLKRAAKTWQEAQIECHKEQGNLASIHNTEDKSFIISQLGYSAADELWIGLNDKRTEGLFDWTDLTTVTFTSWEFGEPSTSRSNEDCVLIRGQNGNWADRGCEERHGFICMRPSGPTPTGREVDVHVGCQTLWRRHGSYCYLVGSKTLTFDEAKDECKKFGSYLADVSNRVDNAFLVSLVGLRPEKYFWLGLSNQKKMENFMWTNSNLVKFTHWNAEMPGHRQGCVAMTTGIFAGLWDVLPCGNQEKYICKHLADGAVVTPIPPTPAHMRCPEEWKPLMGRNMCFKLFLGPIDNQKTWFEARDYCRALGGDLLSIHSANELRLRQYGTAWIGLSAPNPDTGFEWSDESPLNFQHWINGEPNNLYNMEYCTEIKIYLMDEDGSWNDAHCESYNDWLCQIRAGVTPNPPPNNTATEYNLTEDGWLEWQGNQYYINLWSMSMEDARYYCQQRHGDLVVINSEAENTFLWKQIAKKYGEYYIGMTVDLDGTYGWFDGSPVTYEKWDENQPDFRNFDENCVVMYYGNGLWLDYNCGKNHRSICKRPGSPPINSTVALRVPPKGGCPLDWSRLGSKCYRIINYQKNTWTEARRHCQALGGNLVSILSSHVQAFLVTQMALEATSDLWIGLNSLTEFEFLWTDGQKRLYTNWGDLRQHNIFSSFYSKLNQEKCVVLSGKLTMNFGKWNRKSCNNTNGYVCHRNVDPSIAVSPESTPTTYIKLGNDSIKIVRKNMTWSDAKRHCEGDGAKLASISSPWKQAYIEFQAQDIKAPLWLGMNRMETDGYFKYIDGWRLSVVNWASDEPSRDRSCVYVDVDGTWKTAFCNQTMSSVCVISTDVVPAEVAEYPGVCPDVMDITFLGFVENRIAWVPFKGHCYIFVVDDVKWSTAASNCFRQGAVLVSIEDPYEQEFIKSNVNLLRDNQVSFWIGLLRTNNGKWSWLDKTVLDYINWAENMPRIEKDYDCGEISAEDGTWRTAPRWHDKGYICKVTKVMQEKILPSADPLLKEAPQRVHTSLAVLLVITIISVMVVIGFFLYKKYGRPLPTVDNPTYFTRAVSQPDVVDTSKLLENTEEENPKPIAAL